LPGVWRQCAAIPDTTSNRVSQSPHSQARRTEASCVGANSSRYNRRLMRHHRAEAYSAPSGQSRLLQLFPNSRLEAPTLCDDVAPETASLHRKYILSRLRQPVGAVGNCQACKEKGPRVAALKAFPHTTSSCKVPADALETSKRRAHQRERCSLRHWMWRRSENVLACD
jgi:hypothetical protein